MEFLKSQYVERLFYQVLLSEDTSDLSYKMTEIESNEFSLLRTYRYLHLTVSSQTIEMFYLSKRVYCAQKPITRNEYSYAAAILW